MQKIVTGLFACALASSALAAVASAQTGSGMMVGSTSNVPALLPSEMSVLTHMSDADIMGHLMRTDSIEASISQDAIKFSKSDKVLAYAKQMNAEHSASMNAVKQIGKDAGITPTMILNDMQKTHKLASVDSVRIASDQTINRHYLNSQVEMHEHMLAELQALRTTARNPKLRAHIDAQIPGVQTHLAKAHELSMAMGYEKKMKG